ncbi:MAG: rod shape-determining protein RodA [Treponema sp.]|jgi:rod shape determining protein RodA|nr:rod shape-determining protein RodA [Treponema sp.]
MRLRDLLEIDYVLLLAAVVLAVFGVLFIYSSGVTSTGVLVSEEYIRQIIWDIAGLVIVLVLAMVDYRRIRGLAFYLYLGTLALLVYAYLFGKEVNGARAWLGIGSFGIQPSEFAKITTILFLARYLDDTRRSPKSFSRFIVSCLIVFVPMGIILIQPDFGTSLVFIPILVIMAFVAGVSMQYIVFLGACISTTAVLTVLPLWQRDIMRNAMPSLEILANPRFIQSAMVALGFIAAIALAGFLLYKKRYFFWILYGSMIVILSLGLSYVARRVLKDYQIKRLIVFLDPDVDPQGAGWHIIQSITAIGSGGLAGKGYLRGTQSHYRFLPQQSTDFIFSIFTEEWGLLGGLLVFVLFLLICLRLLRITRITADPFGAYIAAGLAGVYVFHFLVNVGMTMGIMPITGIPLLFMSYGGSAVFSAMTGIGLALSIYVRRYTH